MAYLLIVDDDPDFASSVATVCQSLGHEVLTLHTIQQARAALEQRRPDGIVLDVMFPEDPGAGFALAREIRRRLPSMPILMLTAVNQQFPLGFSNKDISEKWLPVTDFLEKPVDFGLLRDKITRLFVHQAEAPIK
jgi:two-component system, NtrC family, nitrogen regulation response regulator NtrX